MTELESGSRLGRYSIEGVIGRGGMGVVYKAIQDGLDRPVALKVITPELAQDAEFRARFQREARLAASLDHPNVVTVYETGEDGNALYLAMRLVTGEDLSSIVKREGPLPPERVVALVAQVAAALDVAHEAGLVHRDVKPHNVLMAGDHAYLTDFGLTKSTDSEASLTRTGTVLGTLDYSAPEQLLGDPTDRRSDVYSLACMTYQLLAGQPPFKRNSDTARMLAHLNDPPPDLPPELPPPLSAVIKRGMAKSADDRFASAGEFARACAAGLAGQHVAAATRPTPQTTVASASAPPRGRRLALLAALPLVAAAVVVALLVAGGGDDTEPQRQAAQPTATAAGSKGPRVVASIPVGDGPDGIAVGSDAVWLVAADDADLERIDPETNEVVGERVPAGQRPDSIAVDGTTIYVTSHIDNKLLRFEADPDPVAAGEITIGSIPEGVSLGPQLVWVALSGDGAVRRVDRASHDVVGAPIGVGTAPVTAYVGQGRVWVPNVDDGTVTAIDSKTSVVLADAITVGDEPRDVVEAFGAAWVPLAHDDAVVKIDPATLEVDGEPIPVGDNPRKIAAGEGALWVTNRGDGTVTQIDPKTARVVGRPLPVGSKPNNIAVGLGSVWVSNPGDDTVSRIDPG